MPWLGANGLLPGRGVPLGLPTGRGAGALGAGARMGNRSNYRSLTARSHPDEPEVAVALSPRADDLVSVTMHDTTAHGVEKLTDEVSMGVIADLAAARQPVIDERGRPETPPAPEGGLAVQLAGIVWTLINRQLLSRDTGGLDVTIVNDIPDGAGLGDEAARGVAFALALLGDGDDLDDAPVRARIAEVCHQAVEMFSPVPPLRARYTAALRGQYDSVSVIDYADGSVTQAPHPQSGDLEFYAITVEQARVDRSAEILRRRRFVEEACRAFGTESLRLLPDASQRVIEWLTAVHKVHGEENTPEIGDAAAWPVQSFIKHYRHEFEYMIDHGGRSLVDGTREAA